MNLYPGTTGTYPTTVGTEQADLPQPIRFANVNQIYCKAISQDRMDDAQTQITATMRWRTACGPTARRVQRRLQHP